MTSSSFSAIIVNMLELSAKLRQETGRKNKQIRKQGLIPAILYGHKVKNLALLVKAADFVKTYQEAGESTLIKLKIEDSQEKEKSAKERIVLIYQVAKEPVSDEVSHIDFYQVKMDEAIKVEVPLVFVGESLAVASESGILIKNVQSVEVEALPQNLPHQIEVDISSLKSFNNRIHIKDLSIPEKVKILDNPEEVVVSVIPPRSEAELEELEKAPEEKVEEVKLEEKKVKEEAEETEEIKETKPEAENKQ